MRNINAVIQNLQYLISNSHIVCIIVAYCNTCLLTKVSCKNTDILILNNVLVV